MRLKISKIIEFQHKKEQQLASFLKQIRILQQQQSGIVDKSEGYEPKM